MISAKIVADSINEQGKRLTSALITFPRIILAELNTHRVLSKNSSSSRAISLKKALSTVKENPFLPAAWQKTHPGMQGTEYFRATDKYGVEFLNSKWLEALDKNISIAQTMDRAGATKQIANRLLEPWMWQTVLITGSEWDNFFALRCPQYANAHEELFKSKEDYAAGSDPEMLPGTDIGWRMINKGMAEIHMMDTAEAIYEAIKNSEPRLLKPGQWHIPFRDQIDPSDPLFFLPRKDMKQANKIPNIENVIKVSTAMAARTSYTTIGEEKEISYADLIRIHDERLIVADPMHASPMEHASRCMSHGENGLYTHSYVTTKEAYNREDENVRLEWLENQPGMMHVTEYGWCRNFRGFIQYRHFLETKQKVA